VHLIPNDYLSIVVCLPVMPSYQVRQFKRRLERTVSTHVEAEIDGGLTLLVGRLTVCLLNAVIGRLLDVVGVAASTRVSA
jgi:hypothetical protein